MSPRRPPVPRGVPTLTDVVEWPAGPPAEATTSAEPVPRPEAGLEGASSPQAAVPPGDVPTLTTPLANAADLPLRVGQPEAAGGAPEAAAASRTDASARTEPGSAADLPASSPRSATGAAESAPGPSGLASERSAADAEAGFVERRRLERRHADRRAGAPESAGWGRRGTDSAFGALAAPDDPLVVRVLAEVEAQVELMLEVRLREVLAPIVARAGDALVRDARQQLAQTLREVVERAVASQRGRY
ncbi:hypothetical protein [Piscinibacter koreensis]|uniref:Uncharacterized protein n=1 Tax=Piscinibacter koreensis TaxID=2742824 RepID=A0A7Y6NS08_9BURK|nr:hypothetical protein [Schlegelella koreensis]NUZ08273.1 hypothetical protein [Schlegelella koreensis]